MKGEKGGRHTEGSEGVQSRVSCEKRLLVLSWEAGSEATLKESTCRFGKAMALDQNSWTEWHSWLN